MFYFYYGNSPILEIEIEKILEKISEENPNIPEKIYDCQLKEEGDFFSALQINSIFSNLELLVLKRAEILKSSGIQKLIKDISNYDINKKIILISYNLPLQYEKPIPEYQLTKTTLKLIDEVATFVDCSLEKQKNSLKEYIDRRLKISNRDRDELLNLLGNDYYHIKNEIDKVSIFLNGEDFLFQKVKNILSVDKEYNIRDLIGKFFKEKKSKDLLEFLDKNKDSYMKCIYILAEEILNFLKISALIKDGKIRKNMNYNTFKEFFPNISEYFYLKGSRAPHPYVVYLKMNNFEILDEDLFQKKLRKILEIEYKMKNGETDIHIDLQTFLLNFFAE
ncbi:MAG: DNA polymerase III subunit delta [Fusobacteriales bacterium]|nr:MAG: DNA polymerase III subunit delta [Fusobacteriales bacterium]